MRLRASQEKALHYTGGRLAMSAVPGSGKTTTLALLAAHLLRSGHIPAGGKVLVVTYQRAAAENIKQRIAQHLGDASRYAHRYEARTLHSLSLLMIREFAHRMGLDDSLSVLGERAQRRLLEAAFRTWRTQHPDVWDRLLPEDTQKSWAENKLERVLPNVAHAVIRNAKNERVAATALRDQLDKRPSESLHPFLHIAAAIYEQYQFQLRSLTAMDYDDLVGRAVTLLTQHDDVALRLRERWPVVLEDEAQDSVPLQEALLTRLTGEGGNWVRVGDPNQAITSTFTAANPSYFNHFLQRPTVQTISLDESGRSGPQIFHLANDLVDWISTRHPLPTVRHETFRPQHIHPTGPDDPQQNPSEAESRVHFEVYPAREIEVQHIAERAFRFMRNQPDQTLAIVTPTNSMGYLFVEALKQLGAPFDEALQGDPVIRTVLDTIQAVLHFLARPLRKNALVDLYEATNYALAWPEGHNSSNVRVLLRSCYRPESLLYPLSSLAKHQSLPRADRFSAADYSAVDAFSGHIKRWLELRVLPIEAVVLTLSAELFRQEYHRVAQQIARHLRTYADRHPEWSLPDFADVLTELETVRLLEGEGQEGFEPRPGVVTITTMHRAKGLEWDLLYLTGVDANWFPYSLEDTFMGEYDFLGGNPEAEATRALARLLRDEALTASHSATDLARIDTIKERLRLLYVGITRARRYLMLSYSQQATIGERLMLRDPAMAFNRLRARYQERYPSVP